MKKILIALTIGTFAFTACSDETPALSSTNTLTASNELENTLLWKVYGKDLKDTSYIFGSINYGSPKAFAYWDDVEKAMNKCSAFAPEYDNDYFLATGSTFELDKSLWTLPDSTELKDIMDSVAYSRVCKLVGKDTVWLPGWKQWKPLFLFEIVANRQEFTREDSVSFDLFINRYARHHKMDVVCLESMTESKQIYTSVDMETQVKVLSNAAKAYENRDGDTPLLRDAFLTWFLEPDLNKPIFLMPEEIEDYYHSIRDQRTKFFCERLEKMMKIQTVFCAVKAVHIGNQFGMVNYFKNSGYTVEPVNLKINIPEPLPYVPASVM